MVDNNFKILSTQGLSEKESKEYWSDYVGDACHNVQLDFQKSENFEGYVEYQNLGFGKVTHFNLKGGHKTNRTAYHIAKEKSESFYLAFTRNGAGYKSSRGNEVIWRKGNIYCGGISDPYNFIADQELEFSIIFFSMDYIKTIIPHPEDLFLKELSSSAGWGKALAIALQEITPRTVNQLALPPSAVADQLAGLLALSTGPELDPLSSSHRRQFDRLRRNMRDRLFDPSLSPSSFAAEHGISVRTLHGLFTAAGTSFMRDLLTMRLNRARALLEDRRYGSKTIAEIAMMVGFVNADHFSTRFRKAFGLPPRTWRHIHSER